MGFGKMVDMEMADDEKLDFSSPIAMPSGPDYPPGLCISLTHDDLEKLGIDHDIDVDDFIDLRAFAVVTSVSKTQRDGKSCCRVELQIQKLKIENENEE